MGKGLKKKYDIEGGEDCCCGWCFCSKTQKRICCGLFWIPFLVIIGLVAACLIKALIVEERFHLAKLSEDAPNLINATLETQREWAEKLGGAIQHQTVSYNLTVQNTTALKNLGVFLEENFENVFNSQYVELTIVNEYSLLFRIMGSQQTVNPYLLCAHLDVVPDGDVGKWDHNPFLGEIINQSGEAYIFGRGAIDDKHSVIGILQALDHILANDGQPKRTLYVAFGHDEEISGHQGAKNLAMNLTEQLKINGEELDFLLDEGMFVMQGVVPGVSDPVVYIGVVEKGWTTVELSVEGVQGHSSMPPKESAIGILSQAIVNLESNPHPSKFTEGPEYDSMSYLAPHASFLYKVILSNLWLLHDAVSAVLAGDPATDAIQRTTTAVTIMNAGYKENVMPSIAKATVNHRIHPTSDDTEVLDHDRKVIDDDRVKIESKGYFPPPDISPYTDDTMAFQIIANSALQVFSDAHLTPGTLVANTDTKHYLHLTNKVYRFTPAFITPNDTSRFHGINERISVKNFNQVVEFYHRLIINADYDIKSKLEETPQENSDAVKNTNNDQKDDGIQFTINADGDHQTGGVTKYTRMGDLKKSYSQRMGVPVSQLRFLFGGKEVEDDETPEDLNMKQDDILEVHRELDDNNVQKNGAIKVHRD